MCGNVGGLIRQVTKSATIAVIVRQISSRVVRAVLRANVARRSCQPYSFPAFARRDLRTRDTTSTTTAKMANRIPKPPTPCAQSPQVIATDVSANISDASENVAEPGWLLAYSAGMAGDLIGGVAVAMTPQSQQGPSLLGKGAPHPGQTGSKYVLPVTRRSLALLASAD